MTELDASGSWSNTCNMADRKALIVGHIAEHKTSIGLAELNKALAEGYEIEAVHQMSSAAAAAGGGGGTGFALSAMLACLVILWKPDAQK